MSRLSRQEIKRDEVMEGVSRAAEWVRDHQRALQWVAVAIVVGLLGYVATSAWARSRAESAQMDLTTALEGETPDREALETVADKYSGSRAAGVARAYLGALAAGDGDLEVARELWTAALASAEGSMLETNLRLNLLELDRREGRAEDAVEELEAMLAAAESAPLPMDVALYQLGLSLEDAGRSEEARSAFQRLLDEHPRSPYATQARGRVEGLSEPF